jgi:hypothetical protein
VGFDEVVSAESMGSNAPSALSFGRSILNCMENETGSRTFAMDYLITSFPAGEWILKSSLVMGEVCPY